MLMNMVMWLLFIPKSVCVLMMFVMYMAVCMAQSYVLMNVFVLFSQV
jgi:hypothetical protein